MKKILLVIVLILSFATHLFAQNEIKKTYYDTGELESETPYNNNQKHGVAKIYYKNGAVKSEIPYKNNQIDGNVKKYYEKGVLEREASFRNGKGEGFYKEFDQKGGLYIEVTNKNDEAIKGKCGNGRKWTDEEISNWNKGLNVNCRN